MSNIAIKVENLSKRYRIGLKDEMHDTLIGAITSWIKSPISNLRELQKLTKFDTYGSSLLPVPGSMPSSQSDDIIWALKDVSFEVKYGEVVGIIGRNGAGKSTLLKILSRITEPTSGKVTINGRVSSLLEVGTGFHSELTGRENIYLNGTVLGMSKVEIDRKFDEIVAFAETEKFLDTPVKRYSSGMKVRLAFAVAAHMEPEILLVDEVLAVGDAAFQKKCLGKMDDVAKEGRTVLFVSHNMVSISSLCNWGIYLHDGKITLSGPISDIVETYLKSVADLNNNITLLERKDREGSGSILFDALGFKDDSNGSNLEILRSGQRIRIKIKYKVIDQSSIGKSLKIGIGFWDSFKQFKFAVTTEAVGYNLKVSDTGETECFIENFPLDKGIYLCNLYSEVNGILADWIKDAIHIEVEQGDYYGTGRLPGSGMGGIFIKYDWLK